MLHTAVHCTLSYATCALIVSCILVYPSVRHLKYRQYRLERDAFDSLGTDPGVEDRLVALFGALEIMESEVWGERWTAESEGVVVVDREGVENRGVGAMAAACWYGR